MDRSTTCVGRGKGGKLSRARRTRRRVPGAVDLVAPIQGRYEGVVATRDVPILTDDYAPTDALLFLE